MDVRGEKAVEMLQAELKAGRNCRGWGGGSGYQMWSVNESGRIE